MKMQSGHQQPPSPPPAPLPPPGNERNAAKCGKTEQKGSPPSHGAGGELLPREEARARDSSPQRSGSFPLILVLCWLLARPWPAMDFTPGAFKLVFPSVSFFSLGSLHYHATERSSVLREARFSACMRCGARSWGGPGDVGCMFAKEAGTQMKPQLVPGTVLILPCGVRSWEQLLGSRSLCWGLDRWMKPETTAPKRLHPSTLGHPTPAPHRLPPRPVQPIFIISTLVIRFAWPESQGRAAALSFSHLRKFLQLPSVPTNTSPCHALQKRDNHTDTMSPAWPMMARTRRGARLQSHPALGSPSPARQRRRALGPGGDVQHRARSGSAARLRLQLTVRL